jgi:hypothetical protein
MTGADGTGAAQAVVAGAQTGAATQQGFGTHCAAHGSQHRARRQCPASATDPTADIVSNTKTICFIEYTPPNSFVVNDFQPARKNVMAVHPAGPFLLIIPIGRARQHGKNEFGLRPAVVCGFCKK